MLVTLRTMEHHGEEGSKISKNAAKKEAAKLAKLQKKQQQASAAAAAVAVAVEAMTLDGPDPLAANYGEVPLEDLQSKPITGRLWTTVSSLTRDLKDQNVLIRGRAQTIRSVSKKMAFLVIREAEFTVQCVLAVVADLVSPQMVKFANSIRKESIVDVEGVISVPKDPIKGASQQQVEIQVRKLYLVDKAPSPLPTNIEEAEIEEAQKVGSTIRRITQENMNYGGYITKQRMTIPNTYGENLVGILHDTGSAEIVILCHGFLSSKESIILTNLAAALEKEGITSFRFDFSGIGESEGPLRFAGYWKEAEDLRAVIQYFKKENRITSAIIGHSRGGNAVFLYASKYDDICTVVNISGRYDLQKGIATRLGEDFSERIKKEGYLDVKNKKGEVEYRVTEEALLDRQNTNMHKACLQIDKKCRVLTVHGSDDKIIPVQDALEFSKIIPNHQLVIVKGANHGYSSHQAELAAVVLPFIRQASYVNSS